MKNLRKFGLVCILLVLYACTALLPETPAEPSEFIPQAKSAFVPSFPEQCEWKDFDRVVDGDTLILENNKRVRFLGIDTPETVKRDHPVELFGKEASAYSKKVFVGADKVCLIYDPYGDKIDKYDRILAYVYTPDGIDVGSELLKSGLARVYRNASFGRKKEFFEYEKSAQEADLNIWKFE